MKLSTNEVELFRAEFTTLLYKYGNDVGLSLCTMTDVCLWELAALHVGTAGDPGEGLAHLSDHLDQVGDDLEPETLH